jgi:hypothetical protein
MIVISLISRHYISDRIICDLGGVDIKIDQYYP